MSQKLRTEFKTLHFGLSYVPDAANKVFTLQTGESAVELKLHTAATRAEHRLTNRFLAHLNDEQLERITHFATSVQLPSDVARMMQLTYDLPGAPLPALAGFITYIPTEARARNRRAQIAKLRNRQHTLLAHYGASAPANLGDEDLLALWSDGDLVGETPLEIAKSLAVLLLKFVGFTGISDGGFERRCCCLRY